MADKFDWDQFEEATDQDFNWDQFEEADTPSEREALEASIPEEDVSIKEAFARGLRQGATLGFADEGAGLAGVGFEATQRLLNRLGLADKSPGQVAEELEEKGFTGDTGPKTLEDTYRQFRDIERIKEERAQEAAPEAYLAGELSSMAVPGLGVAGTAAKGVKVGTKVARGLAGGAAIGGIAGAGVSEADLTKGEVGELAEDVGEGAALGGALGGAMPTAGAVLGRTTRAISDIGKRTTGGVGDIVRSFQLGKRGIPVSGEEGSKFATGRVRKAASTITDRVFNRMDELTDEKMKIARSIADEKADITSVRRNVRDMLNDYAETFKTKAEAKRAEELLTQRIPEQDLSLEESIELSRNLNTLASRNTGPIRDLYRRAAGMISDAVEERAPEIAPLNRQISSGYKVLDELGVKTGQKGEESEKVARFIQENTTLFDTPKAIKKETVQTGLKNLFEELPEQAAAIERRTERASRDFGVGRRTQSDARIGLSTQLIGMSLSDMASYLASKAGQATRTAQQPGRAIKRGASKVYDIGEEGLNLLAERMGMERSETAKKAAEMIRTAASTPDERKRNAILFSVIQNPETRKLLEEEEAE